MNLIFTMPWPLLGLMGGLVVDRRWGRNKAITLTASLLGGAVLYEVLLRITGHLASPGEMISQLSVALGWGLAIIVCSSSRILTPEESAKSASGTVSPLGHQVTWAKGKNDCRVLFRTYRRHSAAKLIPSFNLLGR
jgi:hypothetical protein